MRGGLQREGKIKDRDLPLFSPFFFSKKASFLFFYFFKPNRECFDPQPPSDAVQKHKNLFSRTFLVQYCQN